MPDIVKTLYNLRMFFLTVIMGMSLYYLIVLANLKLGDYLPIKISKKKIAYLAVIFLFLTVLYKLLSAGTFFINMVFVILISAIFAYILNPIVNRIQRKKIKRFFAIIIVYLGIIMLFGTLFMTVGPRIVNELDDFIQKLPTYISETYKLSSEFYERNLENINKLTKTLNIESPEKAISDTLDMFKTYITSASINFANGIVGFFGKLFNLVLVPIVTFYMLKDKDAFKDRVIRALPWKRRNEIIGLFRDIDDVIGDFFRGQIMVCIFIGIATAIALTIIGIDFAIIIGIFAGLFNIVPYLGPFIGLVPAAILALIDDPIKVVWVVIAITAIQQLESNFISPKIVGDSVGLHPLVVMMGVMFGGAYFGIFGMLLAVPTIATSRILYRYFREKIRNLSDEDIF